MMRRNSKIVVALLVDMSFCNMASFAEASLVSDFSATPLSRGTMGSNIAKDPLVDLEDEFAPLVAPTLTSVADNDTSTEYRFFALYEFVDKLPRATLLTAMLVAIIGWGLMKRLREANADIAFDCDQSTGCTSPSSELVAAKPGVAPFDFGQLMDALRKNDISRGRHLVDELPSVDVQDIWGCTALHVAAFHGCIEVAQQLLAREADVNMKEDSHETPLHVAARTGSMAICDVLLAKGAKLNPQNESGSTPLVVAANAGNEEFCELLFEHGGTRNMYINVKSEWDAS
eukprot:TRINITY_DN9338_c0_g1_i1.p1 TRINITY_DN9338_c0_g1~~TRINITY_DN9338_c0_g1_i1.p1  ORF type:complete len:287 (-),score=65.50 TRINITY_DN9338_c0_g1_i1:419-1279(-)